MAPAQRKEALRRVQTRAFFLFSYFLIPLFPYFKIFFRKIGLKQFFLFSYFTISLFPYSKTNSVARLKAHYKYRQRCLLARNCPLCRLLRCLFT